MKKLELFPSNLSTLVIMVSSHYFSYIQFNNWLRADLTFVIFQCLTQSPPQNVETSFCKMPTVLQVYKFNLGPFMSKPTPKMRCNYVNCAIHHKILNLFLNYYFLLPSWISILLHLI